MLSKLFSKSAILVVAASCSEIKVNVSVAITVAAPIQICLYAQVLHLLNYVQQTLKNVIENVLAIVYFCSVC